MSRFALINDVRTEAPEGAIAYKYADPTEDARWLTEESEVRQIRSEDPSLVVMVQSLEAGSRVEYGEGEDHDTGRVDSINGNMATVIWDSGVVTPCPVANLRLI